MTTVKDVLHFMETLAPTYMKEDWDRVGLNCGHLALKVNVPPEAPASTVMAPVPVTLYP